MANSFPVDPYMLIIGLVLLSYGALLAMALLGRREVLSKWMAALFFALALLAEVGRITPFSSGSVLVQTVSLWGRNLWPWMFCALSLVYLDQDLRQRWVWVVGIIWAVLVTVLALPISVMVGVGLDSVRHVVAPGGWAISLGLGLFLSLRAQRATSRPVQRNRTSYWLLITCILLLGHALSYATAPLVMLSGIVILTLASWLIVYVWTSATLIDLQELIREGTGYLLVTLVTVIIYFVTITVIQMLLSWLSPAYNRLIGVSVAAIALTVLYKPLHRLAQRLVDRVVFDVGYDHIDALEGYSQHISSIIDLDELTVKAVTFIGHAFGAERGALLDLQTRGPNIELVVIPGMGIMDRYAIEWPAEHPLLSFFRETGAPLTQQAIHRSTEFRSLSLADQMWLDNLGMDVYVPIQAFGELIGIMTLGPQASGEPYNRSDLDILYRLAKESSLVLRNAQRLFELSSVNVSMAHLNQELQRLDEAKANFLTIASHELKTPLTLIQGYANILVSLPPSELQNREKVKHITDGIMRGTERLRQIIDDMIDISRLDANAFTLHWKECRLSHVLGLAIDQLAAAAKERHQVIEITDLEALPLFDGDGQRLHQAFRNIIENAVKFTPDGGHIRITARLLGGPRPEEQFIEIVVADTGIGIDPEDQERIFDKFYRVGEAALHSSSRVQFKGGGPGLGLAISKGIIEAHGGKVWAASDRCDEETLPGSEFHVLLMVRSPDHRARIVQQYQQKDVFDF